MKLSILTAALFGFLLVTPAFALSEYQVRALFNYGVPVPGLTCNSNDMYYINKAITFGQRNLRQGKTEIEDSSIDHDEENGRRLVTFYPASCKNACQYQTSGYCTAAGCKGFRRELEEGEEETDRDLQSYGDWWCPVAQSTVTSLLDGLLLYNGILSNPCKLLLQKPRKVDCLTMVC